MSHQLVVNKRTLPPEMVTNRKTLIMAQVDQQVSKLQGVKLSADWHLSERRFSDCLGVHLSPGWLPGFEPWITRPMKRTIERGPGSLRAISIQDER